MVLLQKKWTLWMFGFDSGSSHRGIENRPELSFPADLYFEGSDQYRGWFNSSITTRQLEVKRLINSYYHTAL